MPQHILLQAFCKTQNIEHLNLFTDVFRGFDTLTQFPPPPPHSCTWLCFPFFSFLNPSMLTVAGIHFHPFLEGTLLQNGKISSTTATVEDFLTKVHH